MMKFINTPSKMDAPEEEKPQLKQEQLQRANISVFSRLLFLWSMPLFRKGVSQQLTIDDLNLTMDEDQSKLLADRLEKNWFAEIAAAYEKDRPPSLLRALWKTFAAGFLIDGILIFIQQILIRSFQPLILAYLIDYFVVGSTLTKDTAYLSAGLIILFSTANLFIQHHVSFRLSRLGMKMRVACCSLVYRKVLRLSNKSLGHTTAGQLVNLMSNDVSRFDFVLLFLHYLWVIPFQVVLVCYLVYTKVGIAALVGVSSIVLQTVPIQFYLGKLSSAIRKKIAGRTDERVRLMNEIITGIQVIKMYAWEKPFEKVVAQAREHELQAVRHASYLRGIYLSFMMFAERLALFFTLLTYSFMGYRITSATVFSLSQFYNILQLVLAIFFPVAVNSSAECSVTISRLRKFLLLEERDDLRAVLPKENDTYRFKNVKNYGSIFDESRNIHGLGYRNFAYSSTESIQTKSNADENGVDIDDVSAGWKSGETTLNKINIKVREGSLCAVIGAVGSGKSSVLKLLLNELTTQSGSVSVHGVISYCSQEPWLFVETVRNNILFGLPYEHKRYKEVVQKCALEKDFLQFPRGDQTLVGERGVSLSGGQRARINLARAVYRQADVYLLDDPLSAVDAHVGRHLFSECILKYLRGKTVVLVTHQLHYLQAADHIVILNNGAIENQGSFDDLASSGRDFALLLSTDRKQTNDDRKQSKSKITQKASHISNTSDSAPDNTEDAEELESEEQAKGDIKFNIFWKYWAAVGSIGPVLLMFVLMILGQISAGVSDYWSDSAPDNTEDAEELESEEQAKGDIKFNIFWKYWAAVGSIGPVLLMFVLMILGQISAGVSDYWVTFWTNEESIFTKKSMLDSESQQDVYSNSTDFNAALSNSSILPQQLDINEKIGPFSTIEYIYIYAATILLCIIFCTARSFYFYIVSLMASKGLHDQMFSKILKGVMRFFDTNPSGRILNRFSKDIGAVDELLPKSLVDTMHIMLVLFSVLILVSITNPWMTIPVCLLMTIFWYTFHAYIATAQDVKRIEGITKSPVFSHLTSTLNGISTIRTSQASHRMIQEFDTHQDLHTSAWYQYMACSHTLGFWLDIICVVFAAIVTFSFIFFDSALPGNVGLGVSQSLLLTGMLQYGTREMAEVVSQMTSVERILQYTNIEKEQGLEKGEKPTPENWPSKGEVRFIQTSLKYSATNPPVLKNLNFRVQSGWKVGIVGRTGAGKSSLISALFRLAKLEGGIEIDNVETKYLALQDLRSNISIIPQDPVLFSATVRYNLDPFNKFDDSDLWRVLESVELKDAISSLDKPVMEGGANFSVGQRQLVCLARAILGNNQILILDEATANVDPQTDAFIQKTIRDKFSHCTVLTIAHRLNTIMDSDRVLVMDAGEAVEYEHPHVLLANTNGHLYKMVQETGFDMAAKLHDIAEDAYIKANTSYGNSNLNSFHDYEKENII